MVQIVHSVENDSISQINSLLLPIEGDNLVLPMAAVAEVTAAQLPAGSQEGGEPWLYGWIDWRGGAIPVISFEAVTGGERPSPGPGACPIAVVNAIGDAVDRGFIGLRLKQYPRPVRIGPENFAEDDAADSDAGLIAIIDGATARVPDMALVERVCAGLAPVA